MEGHDVCKFCVVLLLGWYVAAHLTCDNLNAIKACTVSFTNAYTASCWVTALVNIVPMVHW